MKIVLYRTKLEFIIIWILPREILEAANDGRSPEEMLEADYDLD